MGFLDKLLGRSKKTAMDAPQDAGRMPEPTPEPEPEQMHEHGDEHDHEHGEHEH